MTTLPRYAAGERRGHPSIPARSAERRHRYAHACAGRAGFVQFRAGSRASRAVAGGAQRRDRAGLAGIDDGAHCDAPAQVCAEVEGQDRSVAGCHRPAATPSVSRARLAARGHPRRPAAGVSRRLTKRSSRRCSTSICWAASVSRKVATRARRSSRARISVARSNDACSASSARVRRPLPARESSSVSSTRATSSMPRQRAQDASCWP